MAASISVSSLKEYLKKYGNEEEKTKKKRKIKKKKTNLSGVLVVDEDPVWQKPVRVVKEDDSSDEEKPEVEEPIEVKQMKRLEQLRAQRPYDATFEDGRGWTPLPDAPEPAKRKQRFDTPSPEPEFNISSSANDDLSSPRQHRKRFDTPSPKHELDLSPPQRDPTHSSDLSLPRKSRKESGALPDLSPLGRDSTHSSDLSPPRKSRKKGEVPPDLSPPRRGRGSSSKGDNSSDLVEDLSPPRRSRKIIGASETSNLTPSRKGHHSLLKDDDSSTIVADFSPPRKSKKGSSLKEEKRSGLFTAQDIKKEVNRTKQEELSWFKGMDPSMSGRGAEPVYRDKEGKRISKDELLKSREKEKPKEKKLEWGKGLAQKREAEAREQELELEKDKPFARTRDDPDLDNMLKDRVRWGDPMAHLVKRKSSDTFLEDLGDNEKMKEDGFIIPQEIPKHSWIVRKVEAPPNRYGIRPGRHWDGVDRSNGTEKEYYKRMNDRQATERESYLWSVADM